MSFDMAILSHNSDLFDTFKVIMQYKLCLTIPVFN